MVNTSQNDRFQGQNRQFLSSELARASATRRNGPFLNPLFASGQKTKVVLAALLHFREVGVAAQGRWVPVAKVQARFEWSPLSKVNRKHQGSTFKACVMAICCATCQNLSKQVSQSSGFDNSFAVYQGVRKGCSEPTPGLRIEFKSNSGGSIS